MTPSDPRNSPTMAGPDPRVRLRSQVTRHTSQIAIHCLLLWGVPSRPSSADVNLARYLILADVVPRLSDSVVLSGVTGTSPAMTIREIGVSSSHVPLPQSP